MISVFLQDLLQDTVVHDIASQLWPEHILWRILIILLTTLTTIAVASGLFRSSIEISQTDETYRDVTHFMARIFGNRWGTDQTVETYVTSSLSSSIPQKGPIIQYEPGFGSHWFLYDKRLYQYSRFRQHANEWGKLTISCYPSFTPKDVQKLINEAKEFHQSQQISASPVYYPTPKLQRMKGGSLWTCVQDQKISRNLDTVEIDHKTKVQVLRLIGDFLLPSAAQFYANVGIPYRTGFLLEGPPGTGKSSFAYALAGHFRLSIYVLPFNSPEVTEEDLPHLVAKIPQGALLLAEDLDTSQIPVRDVHPASGSPLVSHRLSLAAILNGLDGAVTPEGIVLVGTTNKPEQLDQALIRHGRFGHRVRFTMATTETAEAMFKRIYSGKCLGTNSLTNDSSEKSSGTDSAAGIEDKAAEFASLLPDRKFAPAAIQGYLLDSAGPEQAINNAKDWIGQTLNPDSQ